MRTLELENYGVMEMSNIEQLGIDGGGKWSQIKKGLEWLGKEAAKTCGINCTASWVEGFVGEMLK